ncbi:L-rhamnose mutarotase [Chitinophaga jiangningensis]|uniref:L-rhamnose mutarotase n=1 Tax=Chitinophaga jiangningensis TaxID=1419482 RepID=A0A1M7LA13_9BACT|nr:L-rhamnose mutarotase [Chitinophaga jiangningensis]SHM74809.1 L-rhamnose mutarotase [Chitinophaga jiangningensis]
MKIRFYAQLCCLLILAACSSKTGTRYGMITGLKPEKVAYYKKLHAAVWPAVSEKIRECHITNYSIYFKEIDGKPYLFSYWEYTGSDYAADMAAMAADTATQRWWKETAPLQAPLPDAAAKGETWEQMEEIYHQR